MLRSIGVDRVLDYTQEDFTRSGKRYDVILDIAGNHPWPDIRRAITPEGTFVLIGHDHYGGSGHRWFGSLGRFAKLIVISPFVSQLHPFRGAKDPGDRLLVMKELIETGKITPVIDRTFPLSEVPGAIRFLESGQAQGEGHHHRVRLRAEPLTATRSHGSRGHRVPALRSERSSQSNHRSYSHVMRPLRYSINVTLDGCCDHRAIPTDEDLHRHAAETPAQADALLLGRVTYEMMEAAWRPPARTGARPDWMEPWMEPFARAIDAARKYVVSSTLDRVDWNAELVRGDLGKAVQQLKQESGKGLFVGGVKLPLALVGAGIDR
jgi:Zinc-binding dehydrogenase/RibD C-terminal domain